MRKLLTALPGITGKILQTGTAPAPFQTTLGKISGVNANKKNEEGGE